MYRQTYLEVDCNILQNNIIEIRKNYPNYKYYIGVVKANAYGHGGYIINSLINGGINYLAVSSLEEAISLRNYNKEIPILVLEPINIDFIDECILHNITITVSSISYFNELLKINLNNKLKIHLKLDTGMSRLGIQTTDECDFIINSISSNSNLFLEGIYTHFATSGILDKHWDNQVEKFKQITKNIDLSKIPIIHLGRSLTLVNHEKLSFCNGTRLGIVMYGMSQNMPKPTGFKGYIKNLKNNYKIKKLNISPTTTTNNLKLNTSIKLYSQVMELRNISKGDFVGYGASYTANKPTTIATIPIGSADGLPKNIKHVIINNKKYNITGLIGMDMICVEVDNTVKYKDKVLLLGGDLLPVKKIAQESGINVYGLFTNITTRVPRVYKYNENYTEIKY